MDKQLNMYTFVMDYLGGTYISQCNAESPRDAMMIWIKELKVKEIAKFGEGYRKALMNDLIDEEPVLLKGLTNVWCFTVRTRAGFGIVNIIHTVVEEVSKG